ncbi:MAG: phospholipid carrier-dependent glycosyltransferase [Rubrivivax sp.]|nr:phospholipid carrier-dependent glycosyltransferase [Rubrivivax sp.]
MSKRAVGVLALAGILALALTLRLWGISFGLPYPYHYDEPTYVSAALNLGAGVIGRQPNPTGFSNILFGEYATYFILGRLTGLFPSLAAFEQAYRADSSVFILLGRLTNAFFGALTVLTVYWLGKVIRTSTVGLLAALFLAVAFLHVRDSHYAVPDIAMAFFVIFSVLMSGYALQRQKRWGLYAAAASAGLAIATKWTALPVVIPLALTCFYGCDGWPKLAQQNTRPFFTIITVLIALLAGLFAGGFQLFFQPMTFIAYALQEAQAGDAGGFNLWQIDTVPGWIFYLKTLGYGIGVVLLVLSLIGLFSLLITVKANRQTVLILSFPLIYYLFMGLTRHYFARYTLPLIPFLALFAAQAAVIISNWADTKQSNLGRVLMGVFIIAGIVQPLLQSIQHNILLTQVDTRTLAKEWIEGNIPPGTKIAMDWPVQSPPLATVERTEPDSNKVYDVTLVNGPGLSDHSLAWYRKQGFNYLIASSFIYNIPLVDPLWNVKRQTFYTSLDHQLELVQKFSPGKDGVEPPFIFDEIYGPAVSLWQRERPGPTLKIYQVER